MKRGGRKPRKQAGSDKAIPRNFRLLHPLAFLPSYKKSCLSLGDRQEFLYSLPDQRKESFRFLTASDDLIRKELFKIFYCPLGDQIFLANKSLAITRQTKFKFIPFAIIYNAFNLIHRFCFVKLIALTFQIITLDRDPFRHN